MSAAESPPPLRVDHSDGVCTLTLDRPHVHNALSIELREALAAALGDAAADERVRCTVLTGAGASFCAGMDTSQFGGDRAHRERLLAANDAFFDALLAHPLPLLAAVNGAALGGGLATACLCDVRIAAASARFGFPEAARGIPPSLGAALAALPRAAAMELVLTGAVIDTGRALELGLVSAVVADDRLADEVAARAAAIAAVPERATRTTIGWARAGDDGWRAQLDRERELLRRVVLGT